MSRQLLPLVTVSMSSKLRMLLLTTLVVLGVAIAPVKMLYGQGSDRGIITGLVSDASGAAVPNATVTIINQDTSVKTVVQATGDGNYASPPLILGTYTVQVVVQGFKAFERTGIILTGGSDYRQDVHLELGQVTQTIEVTAASEMVNVENPEVSSTLNTQYYHDLPVVMGMDVRLAEAQLVMQPGYTPMLPNGDSIFRGSQFNSRINGGQLFATENYLDGASYGSAIDHNGTQERQPPYDGIAEMKVIDSNMSAQYGRTSGGLILYTTKSGTSNLHGQAYEYNNNAALNARGELIPTRANNVTNTSGYSMGGPVVLPKIYNGRGKTFFFFAFDLTEARQGVIPSYGLTNPIPDFIQGNFSQKLDTSNVLGTDALGRPIYSGEIFNPNTTRTVNGQTVRDGYGFDPTTGLPLAGANVIPTTDPLWSKVSSVLTPLIPAPDRAGLTYNSFEPAGNDWLNPKTVLVRIDHTLMANLKMSTTFNYSRRNSLRQCAEFSKGCASDANGQSATADPADYWGQGFYQNIQTRNIHQQFDWVIKPNLFNHTTVVYDRWIIPEDPETKHGGWLARTGIKGLPDDTGGSPYVYFSDYTIPYSTYGLADGAFGATVANRWELLDDMTYIFGKQTVKFGGEIRWHDFPEFGDGNVTGQWGFSNNETAGYNNTGQLMTNSGDAFASYLLGQVDQVAFNINNKEVCRAVLAAINSQRRALLRTFIKVGQRRLQRETAIWIDPPARRFADGFVGVKIQGHQGLIRPPTHLADVPVFRCRGIRSVAARGVPARLRIGDRSEQLDRRIRSWVHVAVRIAQKPGNEVRFVASSVGVERMKFFPWSCAGQQRCCGNAIQGHAELSALHMIPGGRGGSNVHVENGIPVIRNRIVGDISPARRGKVWVHPICRQRARGLKMHAVC